MSADIGPISPARLIQILQGLGGLVTPILKSQTFNIAIIANTNIIAVSLAPTNSPVRFRVHASFSVAGILSVQRTQATVPVIETLNSGQNLTANAAHIFDIAVTSADAINFQYSVGAQCLSLIVVEVL